MKTLNKILFFAVMLFFLCAGCSDDKENEVDVESIKILEVSDTIRLEKHDTFQLNVETNPKGQAVSFYSSNNRVISITKDGLITAESPGVASLYVVALNGAKRVQSSCVISVTGYIESIVVEEGQYFIIPEEGSINVSSLFTSYPLNASSKKLVYKSSDTSIATVDENGMVTSLAKGIAEISAAPADNKNDVQSGTVRIYSQYSEKEISKSGWSASASEEASSYYSAIRIIDGNTFNFWHNNWNIDSNPPWTLLVDMKEKRAFNKMEVWRRYGYSDTRTVEVYITDKTEDGVSMDDESFVKIGDFEFGDLTSYTRNLTLDFWLDGKKYESRYIRLVLPDTNRSGNNSLAEIFLYNVD